MKRSDRSHKGHVTNVFAILCFLGAWLSLAPIKAHAQPTGYQEYYVLGYEEQVWRAFDEIYWGNVSGNICSTVSLVATADYQVVYYDHWEDGYEVDLLNPVQPTTLVFGDGNPGNGGTGNDILRAGDDINLTSNQNRTGFTALDGYVPVASGRDPRYIRYDGGDRVLTSGGPVNLIHAIWPLNASWIGGAWGIYARSAYQDAYAYRLPIGEDLYILDSIAYGDFEKVYLQLAAFEDNSAISIDNGTDVVNLTLDRGQTYSSMGYIDSTEAPSITVNVGTTVRCDKAIQVGLITGKMGPPDFQSRFLIVLPSQLWGADYVVPVPSGEEGDQADVYLFNPNDFEITIQAYDRFAQATFVLSPSTAITSTVAYSAKRGGLVPEGSAARFTSSDGVFGVVVCADKADTTYEWGFSGVPAKYLAHDYYVSWAPGDENTPPRNNGSPVWVTPLYDHTTFYVDYNQDPGGLDGAVDRTFTLDVLEQERIFDPDNDNTGMHVWATGKFAIAWGADPLTSREASPFLDLGFTVLPALERWLDPVLTLDKTTSPTILPPEGGTVTFTLVTHAHKDHLVNVDITDTLPFRWTYVPGSTRVVYPNGHTGDPDPAAGGQMLFWDLSANLDFQDSLTLTFQAQITNTTGIRFSVNQGEALGEYFGALFNPSDEATVYFSPLNLTKSVSHARARIGDVLTYTLSYINASSSLTATNVTLRDLVPIQHVTFESASGGGSYDGSGGAVTWSIGTLPPGASGNVTLMVRVNDFVPHASVIENMAYIGSDQTVEAGSNIVHTIVPAPDIRLAKQGPAYAYRGDVITYTLSYDNIGGTNATEVVIWDTIPFSTTYVTGSLAIHKGTQWIALSDDQDSDQGALVSRTLVVAPGAIPGTIAPGESGRIRFSVQLNDNLPSGSRILNVATLDRRLDTPRDSNLVVTHLADLLIAKAAEQEVAAPGSAISYTLTCSNASQTAAQTGVYLWEAIPAHTSLIPGTAYGGDRVEYSWDNGVTYVATLPITPVTHLRWYDAALPPGVQQRVGFAVRVDDPLPSNTRIQNVASISSQETEATIRERIPSNRVEVETVNLRIEKRANQPTVEPGDQIAYTITYGNDGTIDAPNAVIVDRIPAHTTLIPGSITGGGVTDGQVITWTADLAPQAPLPAVSFAVAVADTLPAGVDLISNTVVIASGQGFTAVDTLVTPILAVPDLVAGKRSDKPFVWAGEALTYTIAITNAGTQEATNLILIDQLPAYTALASASGGAVEADGVVTWTIPSLQAGASLTRTLAVTVDDPLPEEVRTLDNVVSVIDDGANGPDPTPGDNTCTHTIFIGSAPDLIVVKANDVSLALPGDVLTYTLTVLNRGNKDATGVIVTDTLPAHTAFAGASDGGAEAGGVVTWEVGPLNMRMSVTRTLSVIVDRPLPAGVGSITNTAVITDDGLHGADLVPANNAYTHVTPLVAAPDLVVTKTVGVPAAVPGGSLAYKLFISNVGDQDATGVVVTDVLPAHTTFVSASSGGVEAGGVVTWTIDLLAAGVSQTRTVTVTVDNPLPAGVHAITNVATVADDGSNGADPVPADNVYTLTIPVNAVPDLVVVKASDVSVAAPGDVLAYTLTVQNVGNQDATGVTVVDTLPDHTTLVNASDDGIATDGLVTWDIGPLDAGYGLVRTVIVAVDDPVPAGVDVITNTVSVTDDGANGLDPTPDDNEDVHTIRIDATPDLSIVKTDGVPFVVPGDVLTYTLTIRNVGSQGAGGVIVTDTLPDHVTFITASDGGSETMSGSGVVTWPAFGLAAGVRVTRTVVVAVERLIPAGVDAIANAVVVTDDGSNGPDPDRTNNAYTHTTAVDAAPNLVVTKTNHALFAAPDDVLTYTLTVHNVGNQDATGVVVTDELPEYVSFVSASHGGVQVDGIVTWPIGPLAVGASITRTVTIRVDSPFPDRVYRIVNTAFVDDDGDNGADLAPADNVYAHTTVVSAAPELAVTKIGSSPGILAGQTFTYTITVSNFGNQRATGIVVVDTLPERTAFVAASGGGSQAGGSVTWSIDALDADQSVTRTLTVAIDDPLPDEVEIITNVVVVSDDGANGLDPVPGNNVYTHAVGVVHEPALRMVKEGPSTASVGDRVVFTFTVTHDTTVGDGSPVAEVAVGDDYAGQAAYVGGDDGNGLLEVGERWSYAVSYVVGRNVPNPLINVGTVTARDQDGDLITAAARHSMAIRYAPDLYIAKEGPSKARIGERVVFTIRVATVSISPTAAGVRPAGDGSPIRIIAIQDDMTGPPTYVGGDDGDGWLEFGEVWVYTASYVIREDDPTSLVNTAIAIGEERDGDRIQAQDTHRIAIERGTIFFFPLVFGH